LRDFSVICVCIVATATSGFSLGGDAGPPKLSLTLTLPPATTAG